MLPSKNNSESQITKWISDAFKSENFIKHDVEIVGASENGDGYVGDITFVKVNGMKDDGQTKEYHLVIKHGKKNEVFREATPVRLIFEREIFFYGRVAPMFRQFQEEKKQGPIDYVVKCFKTLLYDQDEVIVLQNLKKLGYDLHDKYIPMDAKHLKITLEAYAKWHALSFAFRDQKSEDFNKAFQKLECVQTAFFLGPKMRSITNDTEKAVCEILEENKEFDLLKKLRDKFRNGFEFEFNQMLTVQEPLSIFCHGDCWNNNFMFKYENSDINKRNPQKVALLDFQLSKLASPVFDVSYCLYSVSSGKELEEFEDLLRTYYFVFSNHLRTLGSDPEKIFSYSDLIRHWKKYSTYGFIMGTLVLPFAFSSKEDAVNLQDFDENTISDMMQTVKNTHNEQISSRIIAVVKHFLEFSDF